MCCISIITCRKVTEYLLNNQVEITVSTFKINVNSAPITISTLKKSKLLSWEIPPTEISKFTYILHSLRFSKIFNLSLIQKKVEGEGIGLSYYHKHFVGYTCAETTLINLR